MVMRDMSRFTSEPQERECSTKTCSNTVKSRDKLLRKCESCRQEEVQRQHELEMEMNREMAREAGEAVF